VIYAGGDDVFVVGAWDDVLEFAVDLHSSFEKWSLEKLTISAGFGMFPKKFPVNQMAKITGKLEDQAKKYEDADGNLKNAICLFDAEDGYTFSWNEFIGSLMNDKFQTIWGFFHSGQYSGEYGKAFIYKLVDLIRESGLELDEAGQSRGGGVKTISFARWVYFLTRMEPSDPSKKEDFQRFTNGLHKWFGNSQDCKELLMALYLYVYTIREDSDE
jgi:CRISPR-associated protein Csm1